MINDLLRRKYEHRFQLLDANGNGHLEASDFTGLADRLVAAAGLDADSPKAYVVHDAWHTYWAGLCHFAGASPEGRITAEQYIDALTAARADDKVADIVRPAVAAHMVLADTNGDGVADVDEFKALQGALGVPAREAEEAFRVLDRDGDGVLTVDEWLAAAMEYYTSTDETAVGNAVIGRF
ncbi:EF-hand domain-containing protein [Streptomyces sp. NPDC048717]|uniref:EF-hand domain-containing protein n=1 Tax=Streptomyces sp. NPDC048717 TaxID=3154928 RepID=UPI00341CB7B9